MQLSNQNICMCVCAYMCMSIWETEGSNTTKQSEQLEGDKAEVFTGVCFPPEEPYLQGVI